MIDERWQKAQRILVIRLDNLGDVLVTTPAIHAIKASLPTAALTLLVSPVGAQVARLNPDVESVLVYEAPWMDPWHKLPQHSQREQQMIETIRERHFDGAIIFTSFHQSPLPAAYLCYLADIPLRAAASIDGPGSLLTTRHKHPERMMHEVERGLDLVGALGIASDNSDLVLQVPDDATQRIAELLSSHQVRRSHPLVVVHPGCSMPARTYPWEMYASVVELLVERLDATVILTGAKDEQALVEQVRGKVREHYRPATLAFAGTLLFPDFCALIKAADLTITNNTGPMHIAAAVKTPVIALFALTNPPEQWGPWHVPHRQLYADVACRICYSRICPYGHECLRLVSPEMVIDASIELLAEVGIQGAARRRVRAQACLSPRQDWQRPYHTRSGSMKEWLEARNILAVRMDNIGDIIMLGPALRAVKETSPQARITLLASPAGSTAVPLLPWIDDVISWRPVWQDVGNRMPFDPARERTLINQLAERNFDAALIFSSFSQTPHVPGYVCYLAGIPLRAGESKEFGGSILTTELKGSPDELHQVERNLRLVEQLGFVASNRQLEVAISARARAAIPDLLLQAGIDAKAEYILLHPGASAQARRYPAQRYGLLSRLLTRRGWQVLVTGTERELALIEEVRRLAPEAHYLIGSRSLAEYTALIERAKLVICNDTLPMHLADAVGTAEVVLFSGTDYEEQWRPRATRSLLLRRPTACHPCYLFECPIGQPCLDFSPEEVLEIVEAMLDTGGHSDENRNSRLSSSAKRSRAQLEQTSQQAMTLRSWQKNSSTSGERGDR